MSGSLTIKYRNEHLLKTFAEVLYIKTFSKSLVGCFDQIDSVYCPFIRDFLMVIGAGWFGNAAFSCFLFSHEP